MSVPTPAAAMAIHDSLEEEVLIALVRAAWLAAERSTGIVGDSDLTRLISGLERERLVVRQTDPTDRRRSINRITPAGRALLSRLDHDVADAAKQTLGHLGRNRLTALLDLLVAF